MSQSNIAAALEPGVIANPFPGLRSFEFEESHLFFGRDGQSEQLITKLGRTHFVAVVGTSGSGKSSLVRAGLLPALLGGFMAGVHSEWRIAVMRPGNDPIGNLARSLNAPVSAIESSNGDSSIHAAGTEATLRRGSRGLVDVLRHLRQGKESLLLVVDQFEEIFRLARGSAGEAYQNQAAAFVKLFLEASQQRDLPIYVVLTMRSDYLGDCSQFWGLPEAVNESQYLIPRLTRDQLREAITGPIAVGGGAITPRLVNRLLNDVGDNQDQLPILQHALMRTWTKWKETPAQAAIDLQDYEAIGGMASALSLHADEAFSELSQDGQRVAEKLFKALTEKGPDNREIRRPITLAEACAITGVTETEIKSVVETFRQPGRSFLMPPADVPLHSESLLDISHESLIRGWQRLKAWVEEEGESARIYRRLAQTAELHQRRQAGLWGDPDLQLALDWREKNKPNEYWARRYHPEFAGAVDFLERSREQRDREVIEKRRQQRLVRRMTMALFGLSFVALIGFSYLVYHARRVDRQAQELIAKAREEVNKANADADVIRRRATDESRAANDKASKAIADANDERAAALTNHQMALGMRIATEAADEFKRGNLVTSGALAVESLKTSDSFLGRRSLAEVLRITPAAPEIIRKGPGSSVDAVAYSGDSKWLAWAARDGKVVISDLSNPKKDIVLPTDRSGVMSLAFSHDGQLLAAGLPGALWLWDVATGKPVQEPIGNIGNPHVVTFSPDGKYLATLGGNQIWLFQKNSGQWKGNMVPSTRDLPTMNGIAFLGDGSLAIAGSHSISFMDVPSLKLRIDTQNDRQCNAVNVSPDSHWMAAGCGSEILIADMTAQSPDDLEPKVPRPLLMTAEPIRIEDVHVNQIAIGNDGKYVAVKDQNSPEVHVYDVDTKEESFRTTRPLPVGMPTMTLSFRPDGKVFATGLQDGSIVAWHLTRGNNALRWQYHGIVSGLAFSPDKKWLAAVTFDDNAGNDGSVRILKASDVENFRPVQTFHIGQNLRKPFFSPDSRFLAVYDSKALHLIQTNPWKRLAHDISGEFSLAAFSPNSRMLVAQGRDGIRRFDTATWREMKPIPGNFNPEFRFSPDSQWLATRAKPIAHVLLGSSQVWNLATGAEAAWNETRTINQPRPRPPQGGPQQLLKEAEDWPAVKPDPLLRSPDGRWVAGTGGSEVELIATDFDRVGFLEHDDKVLDTAFSPDGRWLLTASMDKTVRLWPLAVKDLVDGACKLFPWNLDEKEWDKLKLEGSYHKTCQEPAVAH